jgi:hypothetical protein
MLLIAVPEQAADNGRLRLRRRRAGGADGAGVHVAAVAGIRVDADTTAEMGAGAVPVMDAGSSKPFRLLETVLAAPPITVTVLSPLFGT